MVNFRNAATAALATLLLNAPAAQGQTAGVSSGEPMPVAFPLGLHAGLPQGEFAQNVDVAGGIGGGVLWNLGGPVAFRMDFNVMIYGSETRRVPLGGGALGLINVDVTTTNNIFGGGIGAQVGVPGLG